MATSGYVKIDKASLKTQAIKETPFDQSGFPSQLYDGYELIGTDASKISKKTITAPALNRNYGVKIGATTATSAAVASYGGAVERPINTKGYYFPLDSNLNGYNIETVTDPLKPVTRLSNIEGTFNEGYENNVLCLNEGTFASRTTITNLINQSTITSGWTNATTTALGHTYTNAIDGLSMTPTSSSADTKKSFTFTPTETGKYHFSFYARLQGDARSYSDASLRCVKVTVSPTPTASYEVVLPRLLRTANIYNLDFEWNRYARCATLTANTTYTFTINWYYTATETGSTVNFRRVDTPFKISGILLEKNTFLSPYDVRGTNISGTGSTIVDTKRPLLFNLSKFDSALDTLEKSWMITYLRKITTNSSATEPQYHCDNLGIKSFGYNKDHILGETGSEADKYYHHWEKVILYHTAGANTFNYVVYNTDTNDTYTRIISFNAGELTNTYQGITYNLRLGSINATVEDIYDNMCYRDLLYIPEATAEDYTNETKKMFIVKNATMKYVKGSEESEHSAVILEKTNLLERSTLEY